MAKTTERDAPLNSRVGFSVMRARKRKRIDIGTLADRAGIHKNTLNRVEGGAGVTAATLLKIATALDMSLDELLPKAQYVVLFRPREKKAAKVICDSAKLF